MIISQQPLKEFFARFIKQLTKKIKMKDRLRFEKKVKRIESVK